MKILIIEDQIKVREELQSFLRQNGYEVHALQSFENVIEDCLQCAPHLILLDINLPLHDGFYLCRELRKVSTTPIIIVTSRTGEIDELMSLQLGADDFITKPYHTQILLAHIQSVLKRTYENTYQPIYQVDGLYLDITRFEITYGESVIALTKNEALILKVLMEAKKTVVTRNQLMNILWQSDAFVDDNTLTVNMNRLRKKLDQVGLCNYLHTLRGVGYHL